MHSFFFHSWWYQYLLLQIRIILPQTHCEDQRFCPLYPYFILYPHFLPSPPPSIPLSSPPISAEQYGLWLSLNLHYRALVHWGGHVSSPHSAAWHCPARDVPQRHSADTLPTFPHPHPPHPPLASPWSPLRSNELLNKRQALIHMKERGWKRWSRWHDWSGETIELALDPSI